MKTQSFNRRLTLLSSLSWKLLLSMLLLPLGGMAREATEWVISYSYNANADQLPRVLLVGDSITNGYSAKVRNGLAGEAYVSFYATSKSVADPFYAQEFALMLDQYEYQVILFNNGLHSLNDDRAKWEAALINAVEMVRERSKGSKLIWVSSTPLKIPERTVKVKELNTIAAKIMESYEVPTLDLFGLMDPLDRDTAWKDTYHFQSAAIQMQADKIVETVREVLGTEKAPAEQASKALAAAASETGPDGKLVTQMALNADFDNNNWSLHPIDGNWGSLTILSKGAPSGKHYAQLTLKEKGAQLHRKGLPLKGGERYILSFWAMTETEGAKVLPYLRTTKPPYSYYGKQAPLTLTTQWNEYNVLLDIPMDYNMSQSRLFFVFPDEAVILLDNIRVNER